jgi:hypothetical protein
MMTALIIMTILAALNCAVIMVQAHVLHRQRRELGELRAHVGAQYSHLRFLVGNQHEALRAAGVCTCRLTGLRRCGGGAVCHPAPPLAADRACTCTLSDPPDSCPVCRPAATGDTQPLITRFCSHCGVTTAVTTTGTRHNIV